MKRANKVFNNFKLLQSNSRAYLGKLTMNAQNNKTEIRKKILALVKEYYTAEKAERSSFVPGISRINTGGRIYDEKELINLVGSSLDF